MRALVCGLALAVAACNIPDGTFTPVEPDATPDATPHTSPDARPADAIPADARPQGILISPEAVQVREGARAELAVKLERQPEEPVTLSVVADAALVVASPAELAFNSENWFVPQTITIDALPDVDLVSSQVTLRVLGNGLEALAAVAIADDDTQAIEIDGTSPLLLREGNTHMMHVQLAFMPTATTTVQISSSDPAAVNVQPTQLTFTPAGYRQPRQISLTPLHDTDDRDEQVTITLTSGATSQLLEAQVTDPTVRTVLGWPLPLGTRATLAAGVAVAFPITVTAPITVDRITLRALAGGRARLAIYADDGSAAPRPQLVRLATSAFDLSAGTPSAPTDAPLVSLPAGTYWLATMVDASADIDSDITGIARKCTAPAPSFDVFPTGGWSCVSGRPIGVAIEGALH